VANAYSLSQPAAQPSAKHHQAGLTELVLAQNASGNWQMILPMVAHLCRQNRQRWLTWITSEPLPGKLLISFGIDPNRLRQVHCRDAEQQLSVTQTALTLGNSHTVIASPGAISNSQQRQLEQAAFTGNTQALMLRYR
jgi:cell division inhibitor SulA